MYDEGNISNLSFVKKTNYIFRSKKFGEILTFLQISLLTTFSGHRRALLQALVWFLAV